LLESGRVKPHPIERDDKKSGCGRAVLAPKQLARTTERDPVRAYHQQLARTTEPGPVRADRELAVGVELAKAQKREAIETFRKSPAG
jgi:hypothetical protein